MADKLSEVVKLINTDLDGHFPGIHSPIHRFPIKEYMDVGKLVSMLDKAGLVAVDKPAFVPPAPKWVKLNYQELSTILAALRGRQASHRNREDIEEIADSGGDIVAMTDEGIDELCERINFGEDPIAPMLEALRSYDDHLDEDERSPTGDDYNELMAYVRAVP